MQLREADPIPFASSFTPATATRNKTRKVEVKTSKSNLSTPETVNTHNKRNTKQREQLRSWPSDSKQTMISTPETRRSHDRQEVQNRGHGFKQPLPHHLEPGQVKEVLHRGPEQGQPVHPQQEQDKEYKGKTTLLRKASPLQKNFHFSNRSRNKTRDIKTKKETEYQSTDSRLNLAQRATPSSSARKRSCDKQKVQKTGSCFK